jgi:HlyD family secretion protein
MASPEKPTPVRLLNFARIKHAVFNIRVLFGLAVLGLLVGFISAYVSAQPVPILPPAFSPAANPYPNGIYANGIVESYQTHGEDISIFPEVTGPIVRIPVAEGERVKSGTPLIMIDDSVQRPTAEQQQAQLVVTQAQVASAQASLKTLGDTLSKQERSVAADAQSISQDVLDTSRNAVAVARANLTVAQTQYKAQFKAAVAAEALLRKYVIRAPSDGVIMTIATTVGSYVSSQGAYDPYTMGYMPLITMANGHAQLEVRCYVDEILINRLPSTSHMMAKMFIQGTNISLPLTYERMQPYVSPKIELTDQRLEQVDVRVLPVIFRFTKPPNVNLFPGQVVDVYIAKN